MKSDNGSSINLGRVFKLQSQQNAGKRSLLLPSITRESPKDYPPSYTDKRQPPTKYYTVYFHDFWLRV